MAGLVPAIHALLSFKTKDVDARHKAGHDGVTRFRCGAKSATAPRT
jgi:hypothetical protein